MRTLLLLLTLLLFPALVSGQETPNYLNGRIVLYTGADGLLHAGTIEEQGPLTVAPNLMVRTDANGYLLTTAGEYTAQDGPLTPFGNIRLRTDSNGYLMVTLGSGGITAPFTVTSNGIGTTSTDGVLIRNTTAATASVTVQYSPRLSFSGTAWKSNATAASQTNRFMAELRPAAGAAATTFTFVFAGDVAGAGTYSDLFTMASTGLFHASNSLMTSDSNGREMGFGDTAGNLGFGFINAAGVHRLGMLPADYIGWINSGAQNADSGTYDTFLGRTGVSQISVRAAASITTAAPAAIVQGLSGGATSLAQLPKKVTGIADNSATTVLTVTVPNGAHGASIKLRFLSYNGSTDAHESSRTAEGMVVLARTAGVDTVAAAVAISGEAIATVGGGATHTLAYSVTSMTGAADATQTFNIQVTINDTGNLGSNAVVVFYELLNAEDSGVTVA